MIQSKVHIYGKHAVREALEYSPHIVRKLFVHPKMDDKTLRALIAKSRIEVEPLDERKVTSQVERNAPHQGVVALISLPGLVQPFEKFLDTFVATPGTLLVLLSEVQDPHNVGAVIRSAAAFGAAAVLMPVHKQAPITGAAVKASAGMAFRVPLIALDNMQQAIATFKKSGVRVYGLAGDGKNSIAAEPFAGPTMLVFGNEATGISPAARALCDTTLSIPINPRAESLNIAAAAAVAMYAWSQKHAR